MPAPPLARDPWLDNAKMALVTLVVIGHAWVLLPLDELNARIYDFVYAWHMPAFVLVTGYLSRSFAYTPSRMWQLVRTVAVPYVIFECLLALFRVYVGGEHLEHLFQDPHWPMWYLAALLFWRLATPLLRPMTAGIALAVAVVLSLLSGTLDREIVETLDLARVFGMLPFFVLGLHATPARLELLRNEGVRWIAGGVFLAYWQLTAVMDDHAGTKWLYYSTPYADLDVSATHGMVIRLVLLGIGVLGALCFLALVPRVGGWFTRMGAATLVVYLFHGFAVRGLAYAGYTEWTADHPELGAVVTLLGSIGLALLLASPPVARWLQHVVDPFGTAESRMKDAVDLSVAAQETGRVPAMRTEAATR